MATEGNVMSGSNYNSTTTPPVTGLTFDGGWFKNLSVVRSSATEAKITSGDGTALSDINAGFIDLPNPSTPGSFTKFTVTADVTLTALTDAYWDMDTKGNVTGVLLSILAINDNGTLKWGIAFLIGRNTILTTDSKTTGATTTLAQHVLCNSAIGSASNSCREFGYIRADFSDAANTWSIQSGVNDVVTGQTTAGMWRDWNSDPSGFSALPTTLSSRWTQIGKTMFIRVRETATGTSNSTTFTLTLPAVAGYAEDLPAVSNATNNGVVVTTVGLAQTVAGSLTLSLYRDASGTAWTAALAKAASTSLEYEVGPVASFLV